MALDMEAVLEDVGAFVEEAAKLAPLARAFIAGGHANGTATETSDVVVVLYFRDFGRRGRHWLEGELLLFTESYGSCIAPDVRRSSELSRRGSRAQEIMRTGIEIEFR